jgi:PAS domain S-box-containing protein
VYAGGRAYRPYADGVGAVFKPGAGETGGGTALFVRAAMAAAAHGHKLYRLAGPRGGAAGVRCRRAGRPMSITGLPARATLVAAFGIVYLFATRLGLEFQTESEKFAVFWPPNGLLLGVLLASRPGRWAGYLAAAAGVGLGMNLWHGNPWPVAVGFAAVNTAEPWAFARLWRRAYGPSRLDTGGVILRLLGWALAACAASAVPGAAVVVYGLGAPDYLRVWLTFWLSDALGILLVTPVVLTWAGAARPGFIPPTRRRVAEAAGVAAAIVGLVALSFVPAPAADVRVLVLRLAVIPVILWAALRFGPAATAAVVLVFSVGVVWNVGHNRGVFAAMTLPPGERLLVVQALICTVSLCALGLAGAITARAAAEAALRAGEERYRLVTETIEEVFWVASAATGRVEYASPAFERVWGRPVAALTAEPDPVRAFVHPDDRRPVLAALAEVTAGAGPAEVEHRIVRPDGETRWIHTRIFPVQGAAGEARAIGISGDVTARRAAEDGKAAVIADLQKALAEIKTLRGLIPICAWCKRVRDDAGFWQQVEVFIRDRTAAEVSHGICPVCYTAQEAEIAG